MDGTALDPSRWWQLIPPEQADAVQVFEQALLERNNTLTSLSQNPVNVFGCARCTWHGDFVNIRRHLQSV